MAPLRAQTGQFQPVPKTAPNHQKQGPRAPKEVPAPGPGHTDSRSLVFLFRDIIHLGNVCPDFLSCLSVFVAPQIVSNGPIWARSGPGGVPQSETENWLYLGLDEPNRDPEGTFPLCQPQNFVIFIPKKWPKRTVACGFCPPGACSVAFWGVLGCAYPPKMGQKSVKNRSKIFFQNDPRPLGCM